MTESFPTTLTPKPGRLLRTLLWSGGIALVAATAYFVIMAVLWGFHVTGLRSTTDDLSDELSASTEALEETTSLLDASQHELDLVLDSIVESANTKAQAQDYQLLLFDFADYMDFGADQAGELVDLVYDRHLYTTWSLLRSEDNVRGYYQDLWSAFNDIVDEMEKTL